MLCALGEHVSLRMTRAGAASSCRPANARNVHSPIHFYELEYEMTASRVVSLVLCGARRSTARNRDIPAHSTRSYNETRHRSCSTPIDAFRTT
jgi:hypothetical protein